jgi:heavy metal translocating P-type ATPase
VFLGGNYRLKAKYFWHFECNKIGEMGKILGLETVCEHCGTTFSGTGSERFCCAGCQFVFNLIESEGLNRFYELKQSSPPICPIPVRLSTSNYDYCDDLEFIKKNSPDGIKIRFFLSGMNCAACLWLLEKIPDFCEDADSARVDMTTSTIEIRRKPTGSFAAIAQTLNRFGYSPHPLKETETSLQFQIAERRQDVIRLGVTGALTGNIMILAVSLYGGATGPLAEQFRWLSGLLALPVLTYGAWPFYKNTFTSLRARRLNLDVPIVFAIFAGIITSVWSLLARSGDVYFDSLSMLIFLLLGSRLVLKGIQTRQMRSTSLEDEILLASVLKVTESGTQEKVSSLTLLKDDIIKIEAEGIIPVDGVVISGSGLVSAAVMTGESQPIEIRSGTIIEAGSQYIAGQWTLKVTNPPMETRLAKILRDTETSAREKSQFVHFSDQISRLFITVVFISAAALVLFFINSNPSEGISRALALVIVTCPCVFGIAIPLSMSLAIRGAARKGIIIKNADAIENLWKVEGLYFDKTGTLTTGQMSVLKLHFQNQEDLGIALGLEIGQLHPVAKALVSYLKKVQVTPRKIEEVEALRDGGVSGKVDGKLYSIKPIEAEELDALSGRIIQSSYGLFRGLQEIATFTVGDQPRAESGQIVKWFRKENYFVKMISGDKRAVVEDCAKKIGFTFEEVQSGMSPEQKAEEIRRSPLPVAMIGDGANDAAALAAARVGIAICGSLDVSLRAADVYLTRPKINSLMDLFKIARLTKIAIYRNLFFSASFNIVSGTLAASGLMTPLWAAVLMPVSSLTVAMSSIWTGKRISMERENI